MKSFVKLTLTTFPFQQSRFTKCAICVHLREQLRTPGLTEEQRKELELVRKVHLSQQK